MDERRRAAWEAAIGQRDRGEDVPPEEHYALLRDGMFKGSEIDAAEEAALFLRYWCDALSRDPLPWFGEIIAHRWFLLRERDPQWGRSRADAALREYIAAHDFDHWTALNLIAARLHRQREAFPDALVDWAVEVYEGKREPPDKEKGNRGEPPYRHEERNGIYWMADHWLEHLGMARAKDRLAAIAGYVGADEEVVRKGLKRWHDDRWRRAPWGFPGSG